MQLTHLSLTNFRNFTRLDLDVPGGTILLVGDNAQGKTSVLEAIYLLATMTSFHASSERQTINFIEARNPLAVGRIVADFQRGSEAHRLEIRIIQEGGNGGLRLRKEALLDGVKHKSSTVVGQFNAVLFLPQMLSVIEGSPEERRRYLNLALAQVVTHYAPALSDYNKALTQRNALLKQLNERGGDPTQLAYWDEQVTASGAQLIHARIRAVQELERQGAKVHGELTRGEEVLRLSYQPSYDPLARPNGYVNGQLGLPLDAAADRSGVSVAEIRKGFQEALARLRSEEIARGVTVIGPHRDELRFLSNGIDLGDYGSRGQVRTAMLALKIAEVSWMKEKTGHWPVLLLDEVMAELDPRRRQDLLARIAGVEQALLTTTDLDLFAPGFTQQAALWNVHGGRVSKVNP
ncbi:MAG TPA: DNA replication and repair protein RecF [Anaerolineales bacterium]|nr:DNA replication and repair protein RecF [Anaerolineales bacterium]